MARQRRSLRKSGRFESSSGLLLRDVFVDAIPVFSGGMLSQIRRSFSIDFQQPVIGKALTQILEIARRCVPLLVPVLFRGGVEGR